MCITVYLYSLFLAECAFFMVAVNIMTMIIMAIMNSINCSDFGCDPGFFVRLVHYLVSSTSMKCWLSFSNEHGGQVLISARVFKFLLGVAVFVSQMVAIARFDNA